MANGQASLTIRTSKSGSSSNAALAVRASASRQKVDSAPARGADRAHPMDNTPGRRHHNCVLEARPAYSYGALSEPTSLFSKPGSHNAA